MREPFSRFATIGPPFVRANLVVTVPDHLERVLIEAEPHVEPVLVDAALRITARRGLAAKPPAALVNRHFESRLL
jgi:hypothetical protein